MRKLTVPTLLLAGLALLGGCHHHNNVDWGAPPAYSSHERWHMIGRNWDFEGQQKDDDIDSLMLWRPASRMTIWHVR